MSYKVSLDFADGLEQFTRTVKASKKVTEARLNKIAQESAVKMRSIIKAGIKRKGSTGVLVKSIKVFKYSEPGTNEISYGIANQSQMPVYWEVFNNGGYVPPPSRGFFGSGKRPTPSGGNDRWHQVSSNKYFYIQPKKAIKPRRFIEKTNSWLKNKWRTYWSSTVV